MFPNTIEMSDTSISGEARERRMAKTSSTPGSVSRMIFCGIVVILFSGYLMESNREWEKLWEAGLLLCMVLFTKGWR